MKNMKHYFPLRLVCLALLINFSVLSCSKKEEPKISSEGLLGGKILSKIPSSTFFFVTMNTSSDAYKELKKSPHYAASMKLSKSIEDSISSKNSPDSASDEVKNFINSLKKVGFVPSAEKDSETFEETVLFADVVDGKPALGAYASAKAGKDLNAALQTVIESLKSLNVQSQPQDFKGAKGYKITLPVTDEASKFIDAFYAASSGDKLAITTSQKLLENLFDDQYAGGLQEIKSKPSFQQAFQQLGNPAAQYSFLYANIQTLLKQLASIPGSEVAPEQYAKVPFDAVVSSASYEASLYGDVALVWNPKDESQKLWSDALSTKGKQDAMLKSLPGDFMVFLGSDSAFLNKALKAAEASDPQHAAAAQKEIQDFEEVFKGLGSTGLGIRSGDGKTPFPDVVLAVESENPAETLKKFENQLSGILSAFGMPASGWMDKDIDGIKTRYFSSPMGVGVFLGSIGNVAILTSSESALKTLKASKTSLVKSFDPTFGRFVKESASPFLIHVNFSHLADLMESMQGTLAAFTGGSSQMDPEQIRDLKNMGSLSFALAFNNPVLRIHVGALPAEAEKK